MRLSRVLVATVLVLGASLASYDGGPAVAAPPKCLGRPATIVGTPGRGVIEGTVHGDVIITNGERNVRAGGGDDLICVTRDRANVNAGPGDDSVDTTAVRTRTVTQLGPGDDRFIGGPGPDKVYANDGLTGDDDQVTTGAGNDEVIAGSDDATPADRGDMVELGDGDDEVDALGASLGGSYDGGHGHDEIVLTAEHDGGESDWVVDTPKGRVTRDGTQAASFTDIEDFDLSTIFARTLRFTGGPAAQTVRFASALEKASIDLAGGDDTMVLGANSRVPVDGGLGRDELVVDEGGGENIRVDLARHQLSFGGAPVAITGFDDVSVPAAHRATLLGDSGPNVLRGGNGDDTIDGGGGRDTADGGPGIDHCVAETRIRCES